MNRRALFAAGPALAALAASGATPPTAARADRRRRQTPLFPDDAQFWFETVRMFGADEYGGALVRRGAGHLAPGSRPATTTAGTTPGTPSPTASPRRRDGQLARGHKISARDSYLRASNYYRCSEFFLHANPKDPRVARAYRRSVETYSRLRQAVRPADRAGGNPLRAHDPARLSAPRGRVGRRRPLLIMHTGFDGSAEEMHCLRRAGGGGARLQCPGLRRPRPVRPDPPRRPDLPPRLGEGGHARWSTSP